jgi:hypothetical protein
MGSFLIWIRPLIHVLGIVLAVSAMTSARTKEAMSLQFGSSTALLAKLLVLSLVCSVAALSMELVNARRKLLRPLTGADIRILLSVTAAGLVLQFAYFQPYSARLFRIALALTLGGYAIVVLIHPVLATRLPARLVAAVNVVLMNALILALLAEVSLRILAVLRPLPIFQQGDESAAQTIRRFRLQPGLVRYGFPVNSRGDYDEEPAVRKAGRPLIISIGDSFSAGMVPHENHFTTLAERNLGGAADIYNLGVPGADAPEYLLLLESEALPRHPDVLLVNLFIGNDVEGDSERRLMSVLFDRSNLLIFQVPRRLFRIRQGMTAGSDAIAPDSLGRTAKEGGEPQQRLSPEETVAQFPWFADPSKEPPTFQRAEFLRIERERAVAVCAGGSDVEARYAGLWTEISKMKAAAGKIPILFMLIPDEFQVEDGLWAEVIAGTDRRLDRDQPQERITAFLRQEGLPSLDLLPALRAIPPQADGQRHLYHLQDTHFNVRGNQVAGEKLAEFLRPYLQARD